MAKRIQNGRKKGEVSGKLLRYAIGRMSDAWKSSCKLLGDASGQRCGQGRPYRRPQCSIHRAGPCVLPAFLQTKWQTPAAPVVSRTKGTKVHPAALQIENLCVSFFDSATLAARPGSAAGRPLDGASGWTIEISTAVGVAYRPVMTRVHTSQASSNNAFVINMTPSAHNLTAYVSPPYSISEHHHMTTTLPKD